MAAVWESVTGSQDNAPTGTTQTVTLPGTINSGDLLIIIWCENGGTATTPTGWTRFDGDSRINNWGAQYWREASGSEGASVDITTDATPNSWAAQVIRITNWDNVSNPEPNGVGNTTGTSANPDHGGITASWGAETDSNMFITCLSYGDDAGTVSAYPSGYSGGANEVADSATANADSCVACCYLNSTAASDDPGAWTLSESEAFIANTLVVRGAAGGAAAYPRAAPLGHPLRGPFAGPIS